MKNRIEKVLFGSITRELILVIIVSLGVVVIGVMSAIGMLYANSSKDTVDKIVADANSLYVDVGWYVTRNDEGCNEYLKKLGKYYGLNAAVTDTNGNVLLKTENVNTDKIDTEKVRQILQGSGGFQGYDTIYQRYEIKLDNKEAQLFVWKTPQPDQIANLNKIIIFIGIIPVIIVVLLIYILIRRKAKYIEDICSGIEIISQGNLDYRIDKKGADELSILSGKINSMSIDLKNMMEEERKAQRFKNELITNVSHDLRTPLTSLIGYIQLADNEKTSLTDKEKYIEISLQKSNKLKNLINDLFEYSKLESGGIELEKQEINIIEIIEQIIGELSILARDRNITFNKNFTNSIILNVDPNKIGRVFENIISNAVKYSSQASTVNIDAFEKNDGIIITFENTIDEEFEESAERLFDRFYRADKARNSEQGGSGLGLAIAKNIIELHGGRIWAESEEKIFRINIKIN